VNTQRVSVCLCASPCTKEAGTKEAVHQEEMRFEQPSNMMLLTTRVHPKLYVAAAAPRAAAPARMVTTMGSTGKVSCRPRRRESATHNQRSSTYDGVGVDVAVILGVHVVIVPRKPRSLYRYL
jgi:hypothetical protein